MHCSREQSFVIWNGFAHFDAVKSQPPRLTDLPMYSSKRVTIMPRRFLSLTTVVPLALLFFLLVAVECSLPNQAHIVCCMTQDEELCRQALGNCGTERTVQDLTSLRCRWGNEDHTQLLFDPPQYNLLLQFEVEGKHDIKSL